MTNIWSKKYSTLALLRSSLPTLKRVLDRDVCVIALQASRFTPRPPYVLPYKALSDRTSRSSGTMGHAHLFQLNSSAHGKWAVTDIARDCLVYGRLGVLSLSEKDHMKEVRRKLGTSLVSEASVLADPPSTIWVTVRNRMP